MRFSVFAIVLGLVAVSCAGTGGYRSEALGSGEPLDPVTYRVIFHGGTNANDLETVALLDPEGDPWEIVPVSPEFKYRVSTGLPASTALEEGRRAVAFHPEFDRTQLRRVADEQGTTICYEVRPLYRIYQLGKADILDIWYVPEEEGSVIKAFIRVDPVVEERVNPQGRFRRGR